MKTIKITLFALQIIFSMATYAGETAGVFKITQISQWGNGHTKIYANTTGVNGLQGCTATDKSLGLLSTNLRYREILALAITAKTTGADVSSWVHGCCVAHSEKESPCMSTFTLK